VKTNIVTKGEQVLDARGAPRFLAQEPEPRAGVRGGHIPGSANTPYTEFTNQNGTLKSAAELAKIFSGRGIDPAKPVVTTCGSGVTASIVLLGLAVLGAKKTALYDGSWSEWGSRADAPIET
jgi:thiosulfate/3-mercaptopyruvate sulfurtransferase